MIRIKYAILTLILVTGCGLLATIPTINVTAANPLIKACDNIVVGAPEPEICKEIKKPNQFGIYVGKIVNALLYVIGAVSVLAIIISGILYTTSGGDAALITKAKNTLLYSVVGLLVAIMAYAIVNFVVNIF